MTNDAPACPLPAPAGRTITMAHGGGGALSRRLVRDLFVREFDNPALRAGHDGARVELRPGAGFAFSTDAHVVRPLFFPGGDIGSLAVFGTCNDLAMCGARPVALSAAFVLEEGLEMGVVERVVASMRAAAEAAGVHIVTGDTKTIERGRGDGLIITTAGVGAFVGAGVVGPASIHAGDALLLSGDIGRHGVSVLASREGLEFESAIESDCANIAPAALALIEAGLDVHCLRDCTRGGLAASLVELAEDGGRELCVDEAAIPVSAPVRAVCELLGFDPMHVACEGRFVCLLPSDQAQTALEILRAHPVSAGALRVGTVTAGTKGRALLRNALGVTRILDLPAGELLPRIC